jgi:hypothetical protein
MTEQGKVASCRPTIHRGAGFLAIIKFRNFASKFPVNGGNGILAAHP